MFSRNAGPNGDCSASQAPDPMDTRRGAHHKLSLRFAHDAHTFLLRELTIDLILERAHLAAVISASHPALKRHETARINTRQFPPQGIGIDRRG